MLEKKLCIYSNRWQIRFIFAICTPNLLKYQESVARLFFVCCKNRGKISVFFVKLFKQYAKEIFNLNTELFSMTMENNQIETRQCLCLILHFKLSFKLQSTLLKRIFICFSQLIEKEYFHLLH